jgi:hypothetical protein
MTAAVFLENEKFISAKIADNVHAVCKADGVELKRRVFNAGSRCICVKFNYLSRTRLRRSYRPYPSKEHEIAFNRPSYVSANDCVASGPTPEPRGASLRCKSRFKDSGFDRLYISRVRSMDAIYGDIIGNQVSDPLAIGADLPVRNHEVIQPVDVTIICSSP